MAEHDEPAEPPREFPPRPDPVSAESEDVESVAPEPPPHSKAPFWIGLLLLLGFVGVAVGVVAVVAQPDVCDGTTFRSDRFGYCLVVPEGWTADGEGTLGEIPADRIQVPDDIGTVYVQAVPISEGQTLQDLADTIRSLNEQAGYRLGEISQTTVAGAPALRWDFTTGARGGVRLRVREIVFIDGSSGWRVQIAEGKPAFDGTTATVDSKLGTWVLA